MAWVPQSACPYTNAFGCAPARLHPSGYHYHEFTDEGAESF